MDTDERLPVVFTHERADWRNKRGPAGREGEGRSRESFAALRRSRINFSRMTEGGGSAPRAPSAPPGRSSAVVTSNEEDPLLRSASGRYNSAGRHRGPMLDLT